MIVIVNDNKSLKSVGLVKPKVEEGLTNLSSNIDKLVHQFDVAVCGENDIDDTNEIKKAINNAVLKKSNKLLFPKNKNFLVTPNNGVSGKGEATFVIPSNLEIDLNGCTISVKPNDCTGYCLFKFGELSQNSILKNGTLKGDRYNHVYSNIDNLNTHEWGTGVYIQGKNNKVENLKITEFTGDGIYLGGFTNMNWDKKISSSDFTVNSLDDKGNLIQSTKNIVSRILDLKDYIGEEKDYNIRIEPYWGGSIPFIRDRMVTVAFYNNDTFIKSVKQLEQTEIIVPKECNKFRLLFTNANSVFDEVIFIHKSKVGRFNIIAECDIWDCRRQGISTSLNEQCLITRNSISKIDGTLPKAGIDVEDSRFALNGLVIENNYIHDTNNANIILYDGFGITIRNNTLIQNTLGCVVTQYSEGLTLENNLCYGYLRVGSKENTRKYKPNYVIGNIVKNNLITENSCVFYNSIVESCSFEDTTTSFYNTYINNCDFFDSFNSNANKSLMVKGDGNFKKCMFESSNSEFKKLVLFGDRFENCSFLAEIIDLNGNAINNNTINATNVFYITANNGDISEISDNKIFGYKSTTQAINLTAKTTIIKNNIFQPSDEVWYCSFSLDNKNDNKKMCIVENNMFISSKKLNQVLKGDKFNNLILKVYDNICNTFNSQLITFSNDISKKVYIKDNVGEFTNPTASESIFVSSSFGNIQ